MTDTTTLDLFKNIFSLSSIFNMKPGDGEGLDDLVANNPKKLALIGAIGMGMTDGDDVVMWSGLKGALDYLAIKNVLSGEDTFFSQIYLSIRNAFIADEQLNSAGASGLTKTFGKLAAGVSTYMAINEWENYNKPRFAINAPAPAHN